MSFWLVSLKEKAIEELFLGLSRCYTHVMIEDIRAPAMGTHDLEGIAAESPGSCEQSGLGLGVSYLMGDTSREEAGEGFGCHGRQHSKSWGRGLEVEVFCIYPYG